MTLLKQNHFADYLFSCHNFGSLISRQKGKEGSLIGTDILDEIFNEEYYGIPRLKFTSKETEKGILNESIALDILKRTLEPTMVLTTPNRKQYRNKYIKGTPDKLTGGFVYDIKCSWDANTFNNAELTHQYKWQLICYMVLTGLKKARLFYALTDTPESIIEKETRWYTDSQAIELYKAHHSFGHLELAERFNYFSVELKYEHYRQVIKTARLAREYLNNKLADKIQTVQGNSLAMYAVNNLTKLKGK